MILAGHDTKGRPYVRAEGQWPAIISEETARRVIAERDARMAARRSVTIMNSDSTYLPVRI